MASGVRVADWVPSASTFALARGVAEGGYQIEYPPGRAIKRVPTVGGLRVSPGGRHLALSRHPMIADDRGFVTIIDRDGETLATSKTFGSLDGLAWSPGGDEVWFTAAGVGAQNSLRALDLQGRERILLESMGSLVLHDVASDGRLLVSRANQRAEILFQKAGTPGLVDLSWLDVSAVAALSPDGERILFYEGGEAGGSDYSTFLRSTSGSTPVHLGDGRALDLSPDGQWALVIAVTRPDRLVLLPTGAGTARELRGPEGMVVHDAAGWLPDGETLFVTGRDADHRRTTWLIDGNGRPLRQLPVRDWRYLTRNTFSLDGRRFVTGCPVPDRRPCLYEVDGGDPRPVPGAEARWEAIGWDEEGRLFFRDRPGVGHPTTLYRVDPAAGRAEVLARLAPPDLTGVLSTYRAFVTPDASAWAFTVIRRQSDLFIATGVR